MTPACGYVGVGGALVIGVIAGLAGLWGAMLKRLLRVDDPCDVFGVHGVCGIVGYLTGVFAASSLGGVGFVDGVTMGHQVMVQLESVLLLRSSPGPARCRVCWLQTGGYPCYWTACTGEQERGGCER